MSLGLHTLPFPYLELELQSCCCLVVTVRWCVGIGEQADRPPFIHLLLGRCKGPGDRARFVALQQACCWGQVDDALKFGGEL
jgi:hypothetical protein